MNTMFLIAAILAVFICNVCIADKCVCDIGIYLRDNDGTCFGQVKHFEFPSLDMDCDPIFGNRNDSIEISNCTKNGFDVTVYDDKTCNKKLIEETVPAGTCYPVKIKNYALNLMAYCQDEE